MSTYLLYLGVGRFEYLVDKINDKFIRIVTTPGNSRKGNYALDKAKKFLKYYEDYSEIEYVLPKLDLVAVPDFGAGAMENWGAVVFRELYLLCDESIPKNIKNKISYTIAHELWHQWSGNLVTMKWWDDLWLNESFADYMAYKSFEQLFPNSRVMDEFVRLKPFHEDSLITTCPIKTVVKKPSEIEEAFNLLTYKKGAAVLQMIENYLGEEMFRKGIKYFLSKYMYKNASAEDLWCSLEEVSGEPVKDIMSDWIDRPGHPLVEVGLNGSDISLTQRRFVYGRKKK